MTDAVYALVSNTGMVEKTVNITGNRVDDYVLPIGLTMVDVSNTTIGVGWMYSNGTWQAPTPQPPHSTLLPGDTIQAQNQRVFLDRIYAGLTLSSPGYPEVDGTYSLNGSQRQSLSNACSTAKVTGIIPGGAFSLVQINNTPTPIGSIDLLEAINDAFDAYIGQLQAALQYATINDSVIHITAPASVTLTV